MIELIAGQRHENEKDKHVAACNDWLNLGVGRSLPDLLKMYQGRPKSTETPPTLKLTTLKSWSSKFDWSSRASVFDGEFEAKKNQIAEERRKEILKHPLAHAYGRLEALYEIFDEIHSELQQGIYTNVTKVGKDGTATTLEVLDDKAIAAFRGLLDDMAKETGGRVKKQEVTGADGGPLLIEVKVPDAD